MRRRQLPDHEFRAEWAGAREARAAADDFRRSRLGLGPLQLRERGTDSTTEAGPGVQLTIDTQADTYEQAVAALRARVRRSPTDVNRRQSRGGPDGSGLI
ncbi:hypothetical protein [Streptomyces canus]|uniref:hypothetical protein n=1 Tax=Streptomyces canus TaxID=58343 RepID=UPI002DDBBA47|nr:hypothetical protein [Streptomyces canus]WSD92488.1 hypothetical protein OG925_01240 [Streptomyces canus]